VGLIFAGIGAQLILDGRPVVDAGVYAAAVFMVVAITMETPPLLLWALRRFGDHGQRRSAELTLRNTVNRSPTQARSEEVRSCRTSSSRD